jgi:glycosyltransferase involved in cell wall biosynthesis
MQQDKNLLSSLYDDADVLILTSAYEGLPIVVMDMMARGKVVISTAVDGIPDYIKHMDNGLLIQELVDEEKIKLEAIRLLKMLAESKGKVLEIGGKARQLAIQKFDKQVFSENYLQILIGL